jgi:butyrate kinase
MAESPQQFSDQLQQPRDPQIDHMQDIDNISEIGQDRTMSIFSSLTEQLPAQKAAAIFNKVAGGVQNLGQKLIQDEGSAEFKQGKVIDTLNPLIQAQAGQVRPPQDRKHC